MSNVKTRPFSSQVKSLIRLLEKVPQTLKEIREYEKKLKMFK